ncbi:MAG: polyketide synthase, partial [bacterium]|nr:polyketide synthase [bacterium]
MFDAVSQYNNDDITGDSGTTGSEIAVIGMAGRFPGAKNVEQFWENLKNGVESISFLSDEEVEVIGVEPEMLNHPNYVKVQGGVLEKREYFDASFFGYSPREAQIMDPQTRVFHECCWEALESAAYDPGTYNGLIGIYAGASANSYWHFLAHLSPGNDDFDGLLANYLNNSAFLSTCIAYKLNLKGPAVMVQTACST